MAVTIKRGHDGSISVSATGNSSVSMSGNVAIIDGGEPIYVGRGTEFTKSDEGGPAASVVIDGVPIVRNVRTGRDIVIDGRPVLLPRGDRPQGADETSRQTPQAKKRAARESAICTPFWDRPAGRRLAFAGLCLFCVIAWLGFIAAAERLAKGASTCSTVQDPDERHVCRALSEHLKSECEFIKRSDLRAQCRIWVDKGTSR